MKKFKRAFSFSEPSRGRHFDITETIEEHSEHFTTDDGSQNGHKNGGKYKSFAFSKCVKLATKASEKLSGNL